MIDEYRGDSNYKKLDRYWKCKRVCEMCWPLVFLAAAAFVITEVVFICLFIGTNPTRLEKKIEDCQIRNAAFESSIVEFLVRDAEANEDELSNEKIDLDKSFDYALIYLMRHPELKDNKNFAKQFDLSLSSPEVSGDFSCLKERGKCDIMARMITKENKDKAIAKVARNKNDVGSPEVQVAILTERIKEVTEHVKNNKHDFMAKRGLMQMVGKRKNCHRDAKRLPSACKTPFLLLSG